ncbi:E3 ubiquitin-protein ligase TRIM7 [Varanus komodoensis]|nr:E3 ubiquitin-protein ligase TRIM7 [Varanus komodoensis]
MDVDFIFMNVRRAFAAKFLGYGWETKAEMQKTLVEFRQLRQFLEEQEKLLLAQIEELEKEIAKKRDEHLLKLSKELSSLESIILEMEEKYQQPPAELLQVTWGEERKKFENPVAFPLALKWKIWDSSDINLFLKGVMKQFQDALLYGLQLQEANVTLDPGTANPHLFLSKDYRSVQEESEAQHLPDNPERFNERSFVLGCREFIAGRHFWDVSVGSDGEWAVGVARKSVQRKDYVNFSPEGGIWAVGKWAGGFWGLCSLFRPPLSLSGELKKIRVCLNMGGGRVAFFDADRGTLLFAYFPVLFTGETLQPFFWLHKGAWLSLSP